MSYSDCKKRTTRKKIQNRRDTLQSGLRFLKGSVKSRRAMQ